MRVYSDGDKPSIDELMHYGVKGMKWGVRRAERDAPSKRYSAANRAKDSKTYGQRGVKRINRRLNKGQTLKKARARETTRRTAMITGAATAAAVLKLVGPVAMQSIAVKAERNRARAAYERSEAEITNLGGTYGLNGKKFKPNRKGVYNISSL
uniref:Uncharacterized protein n=1 Tax=Streptomyces phage Scarif TaxID=3158858 RepID=A0AAU7GZJ8_9CAUD